MSTQRDKAASLPTSSHRPARTERLAAAARFADWLAAGILRFLGLILIGAVCLNFANAMWRYVLGTAVLGAEEIQVFVMVWIAFVGTAVVAWRGEHLRMDVIAQRFPAKLRRVLGLLEAVLVAVLAVFMLFQSAMFTFQMAHLGRNSDALGVSMAVPHSGVMLGFGLLAAVALLRLLGARPAPTHEAEAS